MSSVLAIVNCYAPSTGANVAQIVLRTDGTHAILGKVSLGRAILSRIKKIPGQPGRIPREIADHVRVHPAEHAPAAPREHVTLHPE